MRWITACDTGADWKPAITRRVAESHDSAHASRTTPGRPAYAGLPGVVRLACAESCDSATRRVMAGFQSAPVSQAVIQRIDYREHALGAVLSADASGEVRGTASIGRLVEA